MKILFYHAGRDTAWLYPAALQLKTYIDLFYKDVADQLEWLIPIQQEVLDDELIQHIEQTDADILCTSHYLWNHAFLTTQLCNIRKKLKHRVKVIAGGPSIDVNNNKNFFDQHPYIDYAVYGAGEQAFADIVIHLVTKKPLVAFNTSNCAWKNQNTGKTVVADYKFVKMIKTSPFVHNAEMFKTMVDNAKQKNTQLWLPYTLTRGCPYSCTFCDWNSGLGNKVSRRKNTYQQEIDLFQQLGVTNIFLSDANVGQYDEDVNMFEYFVLKNLKDNAGFCVGGNFSKLKKENNLKIFNLIASGGLHNNRILNFSVQDTNQEVLQNIDRPDVGWEVHVAMANELRTKYPHLMIKAQIIYGLPGQTPATWRKTMDQLTQENIFPIVFFNEPLPASPAMYDPNYQLRFQYEYVHSNRIFNGVYSSKIPKKSKSFSQQDIVQMNLLSHIYTALCLINLVLKENNGQPLENNKIVDNFLQSQNYKNLYNNLYHNWTVENNFFYTKNFSGNDEVASDTVLWGHLVLDIEFLHFISQDLSKEHKKKIIMLAIQNKMSKLANVILSDAI